MPVFQPIHEDQQLALYDLPPGVWAWMVELDEDDVRATAGANGAGLTVTMVGVDWSADPDSMYSGQPLTHPVPLPDGYPLDIVHIEVKLDGTRASLVWTWGPRRGTRLDLLHVEDLRRAEIDRLYGARRLVALDWGHIGRPAGSGMWSAAEFEEAVCRAVRALGSTTRRFSQEDFGLELGVSLTTFRAYLRRARHTWRDVQRRNWPAC